MASSDSQRHTVVAPIEATRPRATAARQISAALRRDNGNLCWWGSSHARALIAITAAGGKAAGSATPREFFQASEALLEKAFAPFADDLARRVESHRDLVIGDPAGRARLSGTGRYVTVFMETST